MTTLYTIYKIINTEDSKVYIGSTKGKQSRDPLKTRFNCHTSGSRRLKTCNLAIHMRLLGIDKFSIHLIKQIICDKRIARIHEQIHIREVLPENRLNNLRSYTPNSEKTRDIEKKRKTRRDFYNRKKLDPIWLEKEKERNKLRMRVKRNAVRD